MHAMRPPLPLLAACVLLLLLAAEAPGAAAVCVPRNKSRAPGQPVRPTPPAVPAKPLPPKPMPPTTPPPPNPKPAPPLTPGGDIVKTLCAKTDYPDLCMSSIAKQQQQQPPPKQQQRLDGAGVLRMAMGAVRAGTAEARKKAAAMAADPRTQPLARGPLQDCVESYDDVAYSLDQAEKALAGGDRDATGVMLDTVRTDVDTCDQGFEEREGELTPLLAKEDAELAKLASNCLAIASAAGLR